MNAWHRRTLIWMVAVVLLCFAPEAALGKTAEPRIVCDDIHGYWLYESATLRVEINRHVFEDPLIWYEVDLRTSPASMLRGVLSSPELARIQLKKPDEIAREQRLVYAQTDDFYVSRLHKKTIKTGVIIRDSQLLYDQVYRGKGRYFPPLDALALFPDGTLGVFAAQEHSGEEYLAMGAVDVFSFGPILIRDGQLDERMEKRYANKEPRTAIGIIEPYHFFSIIAEGRHRGSDGCGLKPMAMRMLEMGVTDAINLDGGQTSALVFLGQKLNATGLHNGRSKTRSVGGMLGVGDAAWAGGETP